MISCLPDMYSALMAPANVAAAARFFRVLGDPTRLRILEILGRGPQTVGDLIQRTHQPQSRVSTHLACLRHCGFVKTERRGKQIVYSLALDSLEPLMVQADATMVFGCAMSVRSRITSWSLPRSVTIARQWWDGSHIEPELGLDATVPVGLGLVCGA